jgi:hypothetical protein
MSDFTEIRPILQNGQNRRIFDPGCLSNTSLTRSLSSKGKNPSHDDCLIVWRQEALSEVVSRRGAVAPPTLSHSLRHAHRYIFRQLLTVELSERSKHVVEHATRCRRKVNSFAKRVERNPGLTELIRHEDQVAEIARQSVESPNENRRHMAGLHHPEQLLKPWTIEVLAGPSGIGNDRRFAEIVEGRIGPELFRLPLDREPFRSLLVRRHPAVRHCQHFRSPHIRSWLSVEGLSLITGNSPEMITEIPHL